jgi:hypothetical protein
MFIWLNECYTFDTFALHVDDTVVTHYQLPVVNEFLSCQSIVPTVTERFFILLCFLCCRLQIGSHFLHSESESVAEKSFLRPWHHAVTELYGSEQHVMHLDGGFSLQGVASLLGHFLCVIGRVALGRFFCKSFGFSLSIWFHHCFIFSSVSFWEWTVGLLVAAGPQGHSHTPSQHMFRSSQNHTQFPAQWVLGSVSIRVKQTGCVADT